MLLQRNLIYTSHGQETGGADRAEEALGIAVRNDRPQRRYSGLLAVCEALSSHSAADL
jgi:hypothetical protein